MSATQTLTYTCPHCQTMVEVMPQSGEELVTCPACGKPFQVKVPEAEPVNRLILPAQGIAVSSSENGPPRAKAEADTDTEVEKQPVLVAEKTSEKEDHIKTVQLDMFRRYPLRCLGYAALFVGGLVLGILMRYEGWNLLSLALFGLAILGLVRLGLLFLRMRNTCLTLTNRRCIVETGIFTKRTTEIPMKDIAEIRVDQNFYTRLVDVGDITLLSSGPQRKHLMIMAVPNPTEIASLIRGQGIGTDSVPKQ